jgi:hypothetical protein
MMEASVLQAVPTIHKPRYDFSASSVNEAIGAALSDIKDSHDLTFTQIGLKLGKSADAATHYCHATAGMSAATLLQATVVFGPSLANAAFALAGYRIKVIAAGYCNDTGSQTALAQLAVKIAMALTPDGSGAVATTPAQALAMLPEIDTFQAHIDRLRLLAGAR